MTIVTDLTGEDSDSDNEHNKTSSSSHSIIVTPNKQRKKDVQTTIENAIMRGYASGQVQSHAAINCTNWDSHNNYCESQFIYHNNSTFAAPAYDTSTISAIVPIRESCITKSPMVSVAKSDAPLIENNDIDQCTPKNCEEVSEKAIAFSMDLKSPSDTNNECSSYAINSIALTTNVSDLMMAYLLKNDTIRDIKELLFTSEFKILYDFSKSTSSILPEVFASMDCESGDISYVVKFFARTRKEYDEIYDKLCTLDRDKLPVCCVQTQRLNNVETDDFSFSRNETEVIGTAVLN